MQVKTIIEISEKEQEVIDTMYGLLDDIDHNEIAKAIIQKEVLDGYQLTLGDVKDLLFDIDSLLRLED